MSLGKVNTNKILSQGEMINRENLSKSLVASRSLKIGEKIKRNDILIKSPGQGLSPQKLNELVGKRLKRNVGEEEYFYESDIVENKLKIKNYKFSRPWGVPVRYHDYKDFHNLLRPDLWEFHLSYSDMKLDPMSFITMDKNVDFVVHAPELFENSHLMDLASPDIQYRKSLYYTHKKL